MGALGLSGVPPSPTCSTSVHADSAGTKFLVSDRGWTHLLCLFGPQQEVGALGAWEFVFSLPSCLSQHPPIPGVVQGCGLMEEAGEAGPTNSIGPAFHCGSSELLLWFMGLTSPSASYADFSVGGACFRAPRCCLWEPNHYSTLANHYGTGRRTQGRASRVLGLGGATSHHQHPESEALDGNIIGGDSHSNFRVVAVWKWVPCSP